MVIGASTPAVLLALLLGIDGGLLVPKEATFARALDRPRDPLRDPLPQNEAEQIRLGYRLFSQTAQYGQPFAVNAVSCKNCHLNAGQREGALPLVGIAAVFPQYNKRSGRSFTLEDRVIGCLLRSIDAANAPAELEGARHENGKGPPLISPGAKMVKALVAYLQWLSEGFAPGDELPWRGTNEISAKKRLPVASLDLRRGEALFLEKQCITCHAADGQGLAIGELTPGPLWGPRSWNDGAGMARVYTLAGYLRWTMPYLAPGSLTDEEAQLIAAFINSKPRPGFPGKGLDYRIEPLPPDAVYYRREKP